MHQPHTQHSSNMASSISQKRNEETKSTGLQGEPFLKRRGPLWGEVLPYSGNGVPGKNTADRE